MSCLYLWRNREKPPFLSCRWAKVWLKRGWNLRGLFQVQVYRWRLKSIGVSVGRLSIVYPLDINGKGKNLTIGEHAFVARGVHMATHNMVVIGSHVVINEGVKILTASHDLQDPIWRMYTKPVTIDDYAWVATNALILPGVKIGRGAVVGAGAVVRADVPDYAVVSGNPAVIQGCKRHPSLSYSPTAFAAPFEAWLGRNCELFSPLKDQGRHREPRKT